MTDISNIASMQRQAPEENEICQHVWLGVILQALTDLTRPQESREYLDALEWTNNEDDFNIICQLAGAEPENIMKIVRHVQAYPESIKTINKAILSEDYNSYHAERGKRWRVRQKALCNPEGLVH